MRKTLLAVALLSALSASAVADSFFSFTIGSRPAHHPVRHRVVTYHHPRIAVHRPGVHVVYRPAGHWEWREVRVWVPGYYEKVWVPPRYEVVFIAGYFDHGVWINARHERRLVSDGHYRREWRPGHYRIERRKVWVSY